MKKIINRPTDVVREMLEGIVAMTSGLALLDTENVVLRADIPGRESRPVALISGGGAGHEPAHAGYVGEGMLTAAVTGEVFTSPSVDAVLAAIRATAGPAGALLIVKNYTGDRLNFGLAGELAALEGILTELVVVADDVALSEVVPRERRRGIAGTVLVHKVAGAAAAAGRTRSRPSPATRPRVSAPWALPSVPAPYRLRGGRAFPSATTRSSLASAFTARRASNGWSFSPPTPSPRPWSPPSCPT